jgi:hypothetical protein
VSQAPRHADARLSRVIDFYEALTPAALSRLPEVYSAQARFKDPFNDVQGLERIRQVFEHMYRTLETPRFVVQRAVLEADEAFLSWEFLFRMRRIDPRRERCIRGATQLSFDIDGRVVLHRDYWDAAEELYEQLPALGPLMRWLRRRASSG